MSSIEAARRGVLLGAAGLLALIGAGFVLALSWLVAFPAVFLSAAWLIAFAAMTTVSVVAFRESRATGTSFFAAIGRSCKALGQFIFFF